MPIQIPVLDDRTFEQLLDEAKRRISAHTPEWTNFDVEGDPGITLVELFAFLTESLLYRANRIPERDRLKFLQLLDIRLRPASAANGIISIVNDRGPVEALPLEGGVVVSAGNVDFLTIDPLNVLPVEAVVFYKKRIAETDPRFAEFQSRYEAVLIARSVADAGDAEGLEDTESPLPVSNLVPAFYEPKILAPPTPGAVDLGLSLADTSDGAVYLALLAPENVPPEDARAAMARQTLSIGVVPSLAGDIPALRPRTTANTRARAPQLIVELADVSRTTATDAAYARPRVVRQPDVLSGIGVIQIELPDAASLATWSFAQPSDEGVGDYPPRVDDEGIRARLVTWVRLRLARSGQGDGATGANDAEARLSWLGTNAARVIQAVPVINEFLGQGNGEPDQTGFLANTPVLPATIQLIAVDDAGNGGLWRLTDDLLSAGPNDLVYQLDPESGEIRFGDGLRGLRPPRAARIFVSYHHGGGPRGNVAAGAIKETRDPRLQGGFQVANPVPTSGGTLGETQAEGERSIPLVIRHRDRLVTERDFVDIAAATPGVAMGRVEVLPLFRPTTPPQTDAAGVVTVLVIPRDDPARPLWPTPDRLFLRRVCDYLDARRLVTTEVFVRGPLYIPVYVSVGIQVRGGFFADVVKQLVRDRLHGYLSSLPPGGPEGRGWPLAKRLQSKDLEAVVTRAPGVEFVESLEMGVKTPAAVDVFPLSGLELPLLLGLVVQEGPAEPLASAFGMAPETPGDVKLVPIPVARVKCEC